MRESSKNIELLVRYTERQINDIVCYQCYSHEEIVWLLNILNINDNRYTISLNEIFDSRGNFRGRWKEIVGKKLLKQAQAI